MRITTLALLGLGLSLVACRGGDGDDDSGGTPDGGPTIDTPPSDVRIQDIQSDAMAPGTVVSVKGVIVTAIDAFGSRAGDLFVQEPDGGERSGVKVFGAPLDQVAMLQVGDLVDIAGAAKDEFALSSDTSGSYRTQRHRPDLPSPKMSTLRRPKHELSAGRLGGVRRAPRSPEEAS
jgi:hypothetical protein